MAQLCPTGCRLRHNRVLRLLAALLPGVLALQPVLALAAPQGGVVTSGQAEITHTGGRTTIQQASQHTIVQWDSFNVAADETVRFVQPNTQAVALNRISSADGTLILGQIQANGQVMLVNPNGVVFGESARVDVHGLVASTADIGLQMTIGQGVENSSHPIAHWQFDHAGLPTATVANHGQITAADGGFVALVAPTVHNSGQIVAHMGKVALAAGETFSLDLYGDALVTFPSTPAATAQLTTNHSGEIHVAGGQVLLSVAQAAEVVENALNVTGIVHANSLDTSGGRIMLAAPQGEIVLGSTASLQANGVAGGEIYVGGTGIAGRNEGATTAVQILPAAQVQVHAGAALHADAQADGLANGTGNGGQVIVWADGDTWFAGTVTANAGNLAGNGGFIEVSGKENLRFRGMAQAAAPAGQAGRVLFDPVNIVIAAGAGGADDAEVLDGDINGADGGVADFTIAEATLEAIAATTAIDLEATNNITMLTLSDGFLNLATNNTASVRFAADSDGDGTGNFVMDPTDRIVTAGAGVTINGANASVGQIDTSVGTNGNITFFLTDTLNLYGNMTTNAGNLNANGAIVLHDDVQFSSGAGAGAFLMNSSMAGDYTFTLDVGAGTVNLRDVDIDTLALINAGNVVLDGTIQTDTALNFTNAGAVDTGGGASLIAHNGVSAADVVLDAANTINGAGALVVQGAAVTLGAIGGVTPATTIAVTGDTITLLGAAESTGSQIYTGPLTLNGGLTTSGGNLTINGDVSLNAPLVLTTGVGGGGDIHITGVLNGATDVTAQAGNGSIDFGGAVGGTTPLNSLVLTGAGGISVRDVTTVGAQTYNNPITLNGNYATSNSPILFANTATLAGHTALNSGSGGGDIQFNSTVNGGFDLSLNAGTGASVFNSPVGGITPLANINITGSSVALSTVITTGNQAFSGVLSLNGDLGTNGGALTLDGGLTLTGNSTLTGAGGVGDSISVGGDITGDYTLEILAGLGDIHVGNVDIQQLVLTSGDDFTFGGTLTTDATLDFRALDDLSTPGAVNIQAFDGIGAYGDILFDNANTLSANGTGAFTGDTVTLGGLNGVTDLVVTGQTLISLLADVQTTGSQLYTGASISLGGGTFTTTHQDITFANAVTLSGADTVFNTGSGAGDIHFTSTLDGTGNIDLLAGTGNVIFGGNVGGSTPLTSLDVVGTNLTLANVTTTNGQTYTGNILGAGLLTGGNLIDITGDVVLGGGVTTSAGSIRIDGNMTLTADSVLTSGGSAPDAITLTGTLVGDHTLTFTAGAADISLGGASDVDALRFNTGNQLTLAGGTITTDADLDFSALSNIALTADTIVTANDGTTAANMIFGPNNRLTGPHNLTLNANQLALYQVGVGPGDANNPQSLTVNATNFTLLGPVYTVGAQNYAGLQGLANDLYTDGADITLNTGVTIGSDITLSTGAGGGDIDFGGIVDGPYNITAIAGTGRISLGGDAGATTPLASLTLSGAGFDLRNVNTTGTQIYTGAATVHGTLRSVHSAITFNNGITLTGDSHLTTGANGGGNIAFLGALDGTHTLTLTAGSGDVTFAQTVGAVARLGDVHLNSAADVLFTQGGYVHSFTNTNIAGAVQFGSSPGLDALGNITVRSPQSLTGRLTGSALDVFATQMNITVAAQQLRVGGNGGVIQGTVGGQHARQQGRNAAVAVTFSSIQGGPLYLNGYNLPLLEVVAAPQVLNTTRPMHSNSPLITTDFTAVGTGQMVLNPFWADERLLVDVRDRVNAQPTPDWPIHGWPTPDVTF